MSAPRGSEQDDPSLGSPTTEEQARQQLTLGTTLGAEVIGATSPSDELLGVAAIQISYQFAENLRWCQLAALAVHHDFRGRGIGRALLTAVEFRARELGCASTRIRCGSRPERAGAHELYARMGYEAHRSADYVDYTKLL
jgi:GNAT superfamily N-acetyltransferase